MDSHNEQDLNTNFTKPGKLFIVAHAHKAKTFEFFHFEEDKFQYINAGNPSLTLITESDGAHEHHRKPKNDKPKKCDIIAEYEDGKKYTQEFEYSILKNPTDNLSLSLPKQFLAYDGSDFEIAITQNAWSGNAPTFKHKVSGLKGEDKKSEKMSIKYATKVSSKDLESSSTVHAKIEAQEKETSSSEGHSLLRQGIHSKVNSNTKWVKDDLFIRETQENFNLI